ncbi:MAG: histidine kinase [Humibacillus sp.]|nr:histidine kinase [Humibacillus sp.]MDN5775928.1 histidine kinase [Humibacillus sp.]
MPDHDAHATDARKPGKPAPLPWLLLQLARVGTYVIVGLAVFLAPSTPGARVGLLVGAYIMAGLALAWWLWRDSGHTRFTVVRGSLVAVLSVMAVVSAAVTTIPGGGAFFCLSVMAALAAGTELEPRPSWLVAALGVLAFELGAVVAGAEVDPANRLGLPLLLVVAVLVGHNRRDYRQRAEQSAALLAQTRSVHEAQRRIAVLNERSRIAREIHDVLAHSLGGVSVQIQAARAVLTDTADIARALALLEQAQSMTASGLIDTRRAVQVLRTDPQPLGREITRLGEAHGSRYQVPVDVRLTGEPTPLASEPTVALLRMTQEALVNAAKHAPGQPVDIHLDYSPAGVTLNVSNPIATTPLEPAPVRLTTVDGGFGLLGLRERLLLQHGNLSVRARPDHWSVTARVPR